MMKKIADISKEACSKVQSICDNFFSVSGLTYFNFVRVFDDGTRICLSNHYEWMHFLFSQDLSHKIIFEERIEYPVTTIFNMGYDTFY